MGWPDSNDVSGLVCLVQKSRLLASSHDKAMQHMGFDRASMTGRMGQEEALGDSDGMVGADFKRSPNLHFQSCGHHIHLSCFTSYFDSLLQVISSQFEVRTI